MEATREMTREELLSALGYIQKELTAAQKQMEQYMLLGAQYQAKISPKSREQFGGLEALQSHKNYEKISGIQKLDLLRFGLPATLALFFGIMEVLASVLRGGFSFLCLLPFLCLAVLVRDQRNGPSKFRKPALALLAFLAYMEVWSLLRGGFNLFYGIVLLFSAVVSVLVMLAFNRASQRNQNRATDSQNAVIDAANRNRDAKRKLGDAQYCKHLAEVEAYNQKVPEHNRMINHKRQAAWVEFSSIMDELVAQTKDWFPPDYYSLVAVEFFLDAVRNYKAETVKELVLLFDDHTYKEKTLANQQTLIDYQQAILSVEQEQLEVQKDLRDSSHRQEQKLDGILRNQEEISGLIRESNMLQIMNGMRQSAESAATRDTIRKEAEGIKAAMPPYYPYHY